MRGIYADLLLGNMGGIVRSQICNGWSGGISRGVLHLPQPGNGQLSSKMPQFATEDPDYRIIRRVPLRYLHYYFYIRDPVIGPLAMCVGTYLPFQTTYYLSGHNFIEMERCRQGVAFRKEDNAFLSTSDPKALQAAAAKLSASLIERRLNYWTWLLGPNFRRRIAKPSTCAAITPSSRSNIAEISSSSGTSPFTRSLSTPRNGTVPPDRR
jgi:hypothetical protein